MSPDEIDQLVAGNVRAVRRHGHRPRRATPGRTAGPSACPRPQAVDRPLSSRAGVSPRAGRLPSTGVTSNASDPADSLPGKHYRASCHERGPADPTTAGRLLARCPSLLAGRGSLVLASPDMRVASDACQWDPVPLSRKPPSRRAQTPAGIGPPVSGVVLCPPCGCRPFPQSRFPLADSPRPPGRRPQHLTPAWSAEQR